MKTKLLLALICLNFILTQLEIFLPFVSDNVNEFALLVINFVFLLTTNLIQQRPSLLAFDEQSEEHDRMQTMKLHLDVQAYFVSSVIILVVTLFIIVGKYAFGMYRESMYDIILLFAMNALWAVGGMKWFEIEII